MSNRSVDWRYKKIAIVCRPNIEWLEQWTASLGAGWLLSYFLGCVLYVPDQRRYE